MDVRNPAFFEAPGFWVSDYDATLEYLQRAARGEYGVVGRSQGGRPIASLAWGEYEPVARTATLSAAVGAGYPKAYYGETPRSKPVLVVISSIHGQEIEGCVTCVNFAHVMETGSDLRGRPWPELRELGQAMRVVLVPLGQPDGRVRCGIRNLIDSTEDDLYYYSQGVLRNGELLRWPECKRMQPVPPGSMQTLGGYYNDAGVNIQHEDFFAPDLAPETRSLLDLVRHESPDCVLSLHSCGAGPFFTGPDSYIPEPYQYRQAQVCSYVTERHRREGLRPNGSPKHGPTGGFYFQTAMHHTSGALPLLFEFPHGMRYKPYTFDEILDVGLTMFEEVMRFGLLWGFRPG